jgi:hypothetical protein
MQAGNWTPINPNNPGEFGNEVHARVAAALQGNRNYLCNIIINPENRIVIGYGTHGVPGMAQIDVMHVARGYRPAIGDTLDLSKVKMAFEIKSGLNGLSRPQFYNYPELFGAQGRGWDLVRSRVRWTATGGWSPVPIINDEMLKFSKAARATSLVAPALTVGALVTHAFYASDERDLAIRQAIVAFEQGSRASSHALMLNKAQTAFEYLNEYFSSFSGGHSGMTLGLTIGIMEFIKRN